MTDSNQDPGPEKPGAAGDWMMTFAARERTFLVVLLGCFLVAALSYQSPMLAMWVGFAFAGYSAVANDSIQTIGTFIASNREQKWWVLWIFIGGIRAHGRELVVELWFGRRGELFRERRSPWSPMTSLSTRRPIRTPASTGPDTSRSMSSPLTRCTLKVATCLSAAASTPSAR